MDAEDLYDEFGNYIGPDLPMDDDDQSDSGEVGLLRRLTVM